MCFDRSFFLRDIPVNNNAIQLVVSEKKIFKGFLLWLPWQPEFFMEDNYLKEFERGPPKEQPCEIL